MHRYMHTVHLVLRVIILFVLYGTVAGLAYDEVYNFPPAKINLWCRGNEWEPRCAYVSLYSGAYIAKVYCNQPTTSLGKFCAYKDGDE